MRIWTLHPKYLDRQGLLAVWRETLLAKKVLEGNTKGYKNHPQLIRFRAFKNPLLAISTYLFGIYIEAKQRGYIFNMEKIGELSNNISLPEHSGQILYEWQHLLKKLQVRDPDRFELLSSIKEPELHPLFFMIPGEIQDWEKI